MPAQSELHKMKANSFRGTEKDYTQYISVLKCLGLPPNASLLDYGCSWGYGSWQIAQAGFRVQGFEISRPRCAYAREFLEVDATWDTAELNGPFDVFFSAHVLEHVPSVSKTIDLASRLLRKGGFFVAFTPNGSKQYRRREPLRWKRAWGQVHPNFLDEVYYASRFQTYPYFIASSPYDEAALKDWVKEASSRREQRFGRLDGPELLIVVKY
jgi:2-polyprenyl-3-methyl-5-hydroxy-6-metoxy-1,4-benzoquinol methylase